MIPEPCKYTPDVSFVNVTFFNISAFVNSWKWCQPCFNGARKHAAFKEMAHHCNSQNYKCCQNATFSLYWLAPGKAALRIILSYMPVSADVSPRGHTERELPGLPWEGERQSPREPGVPLSHPQWAKVEQEGMRGLLLPLLWSPSIANRQSQGYTHFTRAREEAKCTFSTGTDVVIWLRYIFLWHRLLLLGRSSLQR